MSNYQNNKQPTTEESINLDSFQNVSISSPQTSLNQMSSFSSWIQSSFNISLIDINTKEEENEKDLF